MIFSRLATVLAFAVNTIAQESSSVLTISGGSSSSDGADTTILSGTSEMRTPTGSYISYDTTITRSTATAITTSVLVSLITANSVTRTRTIGTTTIFGLNGTPIVASNSSGTQTGSSVTTSQSRLVLEGSARTSLSPNGTANSTASATTTAIQPTNTTPCNLYAEFCERSYSNITEVAAHNSPFIRPGNSAANQELDVIQQLDDGIRLLQGQMHFVNGTPHFCHGSCDVLDAGPITDYLARVYDWIAAHPFDVVTLLLGNALGADGLYPLIDKYIPFFEQTGLQRFAYEPPIIPMAIGDWPTLSSMILSGKRVVIFMDYFANQTALPWVLDEFSHTWETPFDPTDRSFPCTVQRPPDLNDEEIRKRMYLVNHNLNYDINLLGNSILVPQIPLLNITNNVTGEGSLGMNAANCLEMWDYPPRWLNVDYYNVGNGSVFEVAAKYNNVTYDRPCCGLVAANSGMKVGGVTSFMVIALLGCVSLLML